MTEAISTLKALVPITYAGQDFQPGAIFYAWKHDALKMINLDQADPFGLEDPSTLPVEDILETLVPPPINVVSITPVGVIVPVGGDNGSIQVTIVRVGVSGTWTVQKDPSATWLAYTPLTPQTTNGTATWIADPNPDPGDRTTSLNINGQMFQIVQDGTLPG